MTTAHRISNLAGVVVPFIGLIAAIVLLWNTLVDWSDLIVLAVMYVLCGFGVTVGLPPDAHAPLVRDAQADPVRCSGSSARWPSRAP